MIPHVPTTTTVQPSKPPQRLIGSMLMALLPYAEMALLLIACGYGWR